MYNFNFTHVINKEVDDNGNKTFTGDSVSFNVPGVDKFKAANIQYAAYTPYKAPVMETATYVVPTIDPTVYNNASFTLYVKLEGSVLSTYAQELIKFERPFIVAFTPTGTPSTDAATIATLLNKYKLRQDIYPVNVTVSGATLTFTATSQYQTFSKVNLIGVKIETEATVWNYNFNIDITSAGTFTTTQNHVIGMGDDDYMISAVQIPTTENTAYYGLRKYSRPVAGGNYSCFIIKYNVARPFDEGILSGLSTTVTHIFYVISTASADFLAALKKTTTVESNEAATPATLTTLINGTAGTAVSIAVGATAAVTVNDTNEVGYTTSDATKATVNADGVITGVAAGTAIITVTDVIQNAVGTITVTVTAS